MSATFLGFGIGLRPKHYAHVLERWPQIDFFEVISENYMVDGGRPLHVLDKIRERYPVLMHGVSLSLGSTDPLSKDYLKRLKLLAKRVEPAWISDHLCWGGVGGKNAHDLLPLPYTEETIRHVVRRIQNVQDFLGTRIAIENVSSYMAFEASQMSEWEFLKAIVEEADCQILLDVNNIYVSAFNHSFDPETYINAIPKGSVVQFHLAGHSNKGDYLLDTHDHPIIPAVWKLYRKAIERFGNVSTLIEWDDQIPSFPKLQAAADKAKEIHRILCEEKNRKPQRDPADPVEIYHSA